MTDVVLRVSGLRVAYGGLRAARSARVGAYRAPPFPVPSPAGEGSAHRTPRAMTDVVLRVAGLQRRLWRDSSSQGHRPRDPGRRTGHADRRQRRGQDDHAESDHGDAGVGRRDRLHGQVDARHGALPAAGQGPCDGPRRSRRVRAHDGHREPADGRLRPARQGRREARRRRDVRLVPAPEGTRQAAGRHAVRRRAADARDGARADEPAEDCCCSTNRRWVSRPSWSRRCSR